MRRNYLKVKVGSRKFELGPVRLRDWIELCLAAQAVAEAKPLPKEQRRAYGMLVDSLTALGRPRQRKRLERELRAAPFPQLHTLYLLVVSSLVKDPDEEREKAPEKSAGASSLLSREELLLPAYRTARILGEPVSQVLDLDVRDYDREARMADALLAGFELELLQVVIEPHVMRRHGRGLYDHLMGRARKVKTKDGGKWRKQAADARRLI